MEKQTAHSSTCDEAKLVLCSGQFSLQYFKENYEKERIAPMYCCVFKVFWNILSICDALSNQEVMNCKFQAILKIPHIRRFCKV